MPWWAWTWPLLAWLVLLTTFLSAAGPVPAAAAELALITTVFSAVYHAEMVAHRIGEPFGTIVLAIAVTIIEGALIVSVIIAAPAEKADLARDTVFAAVMIVCNGIVGLCLLWGGARHREQGFQVQGASAALAVLAALTTLTLVLPNVATTVPGPVFSTSQLEFDAVVSLVLYGGFIFVQTVRHRDYFLPLVSDDEAAHIKRPTNTTALASFGLLLVAVVAVVQSRSRHRHCGPGVDAGRAGRGSGRARQSLANELKSRPGLRTCQYRLDDSDCCRRCDRAGSADHAWPGAKGPGSTCADALHQCHHLGNGTNHGPAGRHPPCHFRRVFVLCDRPIDSSASVGPTSVALHRPRLYCTGNSKLIRCATGRLTRTH